MRVTRQHVKERTRIDQTGVCKFPLCARLRAVGVDGQYLGISDGIRLVRDCQVPMRGCRLTDATIELELDADGFTLSEV